MKHVLVVEDEETIGLVIRKILEKHVGCRVTLTASPDEAVELLDRDPVALILMDVSLLGARLAGVPCDGAQLARHIRQHPRHATIPILLVTAHTLRSERERLMSVSAADGFIEKPFDGIEGLAGPVRNLLAA